MLMSKEVELRTLTRLAAAGQLGWMSLPKSVRRGDAVQEMLAVGVLIKQRRGAGAVVKVAEQEALDQYLNQRFPGRYTTAAGDAFGNQARYRDSKGAAKSSIGVVLLRGWQTIEVNGKTVDLAGPTNSFGCFSVLKPSLAAVRLCVVENLDCFVKAEKLLGNDWVYAHPYGRLGEETFERLTASDILHFGDWDYTGLDEYLRLRSKYPQTKLYVPNELEGYWERQSTPLKSKAVITRRLKESKVTEVRRILNLLGRTNRFLEQQAVFLPENDSL